MNTQVSFSRLSECGPGGVVTPWALPRDRRKKNSGFLGPYPPSYRWRFFPYRPPVPKIRSPLKKVEKKYFPYDC
jgi:hypothetical protein